MSVRPSFFSSETRGDLVKNRLQRLFFLGKLPFGISLKIGSLYLKKLAGIKGTKQESELNYFFLTMINTGTFYKNQDEKRYVLKNKKGFVFVARKGDDSDLEVFNQVWGRAVYKVATDKLKEMVGTQDRVNIIDAGANVGYTALFFLAEFPNASVISIEPDGENFEMLRSNLENNGFGKTKTIQAAVWDRNCNLLIKRDGYDGRSWSIQVEETTDESGLKAITLNEVVKQNGFQEIDLLKIDIEGAEHNVFKDKKAAVELLNITKVLAIEIHDQLADRKAIYSVLKECGFEIEHVEDLTIAYRKK